MPWASTAISVGGSLLGGALGGGSKSAERAAKDAAALQMQRIQEAQLNAKASVNPFIETGTQANRLLSQYLGTDTSAYGQRPTREQAAAEVRDSHFAKYGKDYGRNSNMGWVEKETDKIYQQKLQAWEAGLEKWKQENPDSMGDGRLLRDFTNSDFVKDPGYNFRLAEGEKGVNRALAARGGFNSGSALKALARYNQDYGSNEFGNAYNRDAANKSRIYSFLSGQSAQGLGAASNQGAAGSNAAALMAGISQNATNQVNQMQSDRNMTYANAIQGAIGNLVYGMNRPKDSPVSSVPAWSTPPYVQQGSSSIQSTPWYLE